MQFPNLPATIRLPLLSKAAYQGLLLLKYSPCNFLPVFQRPLMKNIDVIAPDRRHNKTARVQIYGSMKRAVAEPFSL